MISDPSQFKYTLKQKHLKGQLPWTNTDGHRDLTYNPTQCTR